jgi:hypothetical protein
MFREVLWRLETREHSVSLSRRRLTMPLPVIGKRYTPA